jgi:hypothetical protein
MATGSAINAIILEEQLFFIGTTICLKPAQDVRAYTGSQRRGMRLTCGCLALFLSGGLAMADSLTALGGGWSRYINERFGTVLDVPSQRFEMVEPPPENGDGREFRGEDGARLLVYGTYAPFAILSGFEEYKRDLLAQAERRGLNVTYQQSGKGWLVFSGLTGTNIVYTKVTEGCEAAHEFTIEYPAASKAAYDRVVTRLSRTLSCRRPPSR